MVVTHAEANVFALSVEKAYLARVALKERPLVPLLVCKMVGCAAAYESDRIGVMVLAHTRVLKDARRDNGASGCDAVKVLGAIYADSGGHCVRSSEPRCGALQIYGHEL